MFLGHCYIDLDDLEKCKDHADKAITIAESFKYSTTEIGLNKITSAMAMTNSNEADIDLEPLYAFEAKNKMKRWSGLMRRNIAFVLLNIDDRHMSEAESWIQKAIQADEENSTTWDLAKDYRLYADWFERKGHLSRARENLTKAIQTFQECGADGWVQRTENKLARL